MVCCRLPQGILSHTEVGLLSPPTYPRSILFTPREGLNNPHLGRNAIGCGSKIRFEDLSER